MSHMDEHRVLTLRDRLAHGAFPGIDFGQAMKFLLTGGVMPADDLPVDSLMLLDEWAHDLSSIQSEPPTRVFTATQLKNETGTVVDAALGGNRVVITRHGRPTVEIRGLS